jgi:hypothetical protein
MSTAKKKYLAAALIVAGSAAAAAYAVRRRRDRAVDQEIAGLLAEAEIPAVQPEVVRQEVLGAQLVLDPQP